MSLITNEMILAVWKEKIDLKKLILGEELSFKMVPDSVFEVLQQHYESGLDIIWRHMDDCDKDYKHTCSCKGMMIIKMK